MKSTESKNMKNVVEKVVVNVGVGRMSQENNFEEKILPQVMQDVADISGQKPQIRKARKSIAGFKIREGQVVGLRVTLREKKMVDFLTRLIKIVLPRVPDFHGLSTGSVDDGGTLNIGFREQYAFPEIVAEQSLRSFSLGVNIVPVVKDRESAVSAYREIGVPFEKKDEDTEGKK